MSDTNIPDTENLVATPPAGTIEGQQKIDPRPKPNTPEWLARANNFPQPTWLKTPSNLPEPAHLRQGPLADPPAPKNPATDAPFQ